MSGNVIFSVSIVLLSLNLCSAQVLQFGTCVNVETMTYFDLEKFLGKWYEIERFPTWYEDYGHCAYKSIQACGRKIEIDHSFVRDGIHFILHVNSTYSPGDIAVFVIEQSNIDPIGIPLSVIATDYDNYAIVYGCKNREILGLKYISAWILSRQPTISEEVRAKAYSELNAIPYASTAFLEPVVQTGPLCSFHWTAHVQADYVDSNDE